MFTSYAAWSFIKEASIKGNLDVKISRGLIGANAIKLKY